LSQPKLLWVYGWDRLVSDLLSAALSSYGWRVLDSLNSISESYDAGIVVVYCSQTKVKEALEKIRGAKAQYPNSKILLVGNKIPERLLLRFIRMGIVAYFDTNQRLPELIEAIQMVQTSRNLTSGRVVELVLENIRRLRRVAPPKHAALTCREMDVFRLITAGLSNKQIADRLSITPNTVKNHVHNLLEKLNAKSRHEAAWLHSLSSRKAFLGDPRSTFRTANI